MAAQQLREDVGNSSFAAGVSKFEEAMRVEPKAQETVLVRADVVSHPLFPVLEAAILQAMYGKGQRHGGNVTPFLDQPWVHYAKLHGRGFLTGQAAKKLEEAASTRTGEGYEAEVFGAIVYAGMSVLKDRGVV